MSIELAIARERFFQFLSQNIKDLRDQFEQFRIFVESSENLFRVTTDKDPDPLNSENRLTFTVYEPSDLLNISGQNLNQILRDITNKRIEQHRTLREAAESLGVDVRTLKRYAAWQEPEYSEHTDRRKED